METEITPSARFYDFLAWTYANKKGLGLAVAIIAVGSFITTFMIWQNNQRELSANEALSTAQPGRSSARVADAVPAEAYLKVANDFNGTSAGARALLMGAVTLFVEGNFSEAQTRFAKFQSDYPDSPLVPQAILGIAACLDAQGKGSDAATKFQEVISRYPKDHNVNQAKLALASIYENQNKPELAQRIYSELTQVTAYSSSSAEAGARLEELLLKHPNLAATNSPTATATKP